MTYAAQGRAALNAPPLSTNYSAGSGRSSMDENVIMYHLEDLRYRWSQAHAQWLQADTYYNLRFNVWGPEHGGRVAIRPPTARAIIDHAVDTQIGYTPRVHRPPVGDGDSHRQDADQVENALQAVMHSSSMYESVLPYKLLSKHLTLYGYGVMCGPTLQDPYNMMLSKPKQERNENNEEFRRREQAYEARRRNWNPIRISAPHPSQIYMDPTEKNPKFAIHQKRVQTADLKSYIAEREMGVGGSAKRWLDLHEDYEILEVVEYWTPDSQTVMFLNGEILWQKPNLWGFVPYSHGFSGWGMDFSYAYETNEYSYAANMSVGLLYPLYEYLRAEAQYKSALHNILINHAYAPIASQDPTRLRQAIEGNEILQGRADEHSVVQLTPPVDANMLAIGDELARDIEFTVPTRVLSGGREPGVTTVGQTAIMSTAARRKYQSIAVQMEHIATSIGSKILQLVDVSEALEGRIGASNAQLTKGILHGDYSVAVTFEVNDPVLDLQRRQLNMNEHDRGLIDRNTYWREAGYGDGSEIRKGLLRDAIEQDPRVHQQLVLQVAEEEGVADIVRQSQSEQNAQQLQGAAPSQQEAQLTAGQSAANNALAQSGLRQPLTDDIAKPARIDLGR